MIDSPSLVVPDLPSGLPPSPACDDGLPAARRRHRGRAEWADLIDAQAQSGLTVAAFCQQHDLGVASFYGWRRQLASREEACSPAPAFVRLQPTAGHDDQPLTADFPNGVRLTLGVSALPALVAALCEAGPSC